MLCFKRICERIDKLCHDGGPYHIETSLLTCSVNQWTSFYMIRNSVMKELKNLINNDDK